MKKNCKKNKNEFTIEKVIKRKCNRLYITWKGYNNFFNSWIDKKTHSIAVVDLKNCQPELSYMIA